ELPVRAEAEVMPAVVVGLGPGSAVVRDGRRTHVPVARDRRRGARDGAGPRRSRVVGPLRPRRVDMRLRWRRRGARLAHTDTARTGGLDLLPRRWSRWLRTRRVLGNLAVRGDEPGGVAEAEWIVERVAVRIVALTEQRIGDHRVGRQESILI